MIIGAVAKPNMGFFFRGTDVSRWSDLFCKSGRRVMIESEFWRSFLVVLFNSPDLLSIFRQECIPRKCD